MRTSRRQDTDGFKQEAVGLLASSGRPLRRIAEELGISAARLRAWPNRNGGSQAGLPPRPNTQAAIPPAGVDLAAENARLRRENERLRREREILKNVWPAPSASDFIESAENNQSASTYPASE